ncbi:CocE/NonD family hydrolase [Hoylesella oralis]|uniref:CocE/NonD family hydrolase n=1 Tax=Hoylesella oralis TaxID=28134 RepID=UPI0028EEFD75|nr:CocE/NonD family hydrolase [Hoylesella oralis]
MEKYFILMALCGLTFSCMAQVSSNAVSSAEYPGGKGWQPGPARYGAEIIKGISIAMDDGIMLEAKVAYPTNLQSQKHAGEKFPVLVEFTPYEGEGAEERLPYTFLVQHGYIVALVHPRGSGKSTGELQQFSSRDGMDGKTVVEWASTLDGSNGKVGFYGASYPGALALATAAKVGKGSPLKAILAGAIGLGAQYRQAWTNNGLPTVLMMGYAPHAKGAMGGNEGAERHFVNFDKEFWAGNDPAYDGAFWQDRIPLRWSRDIVGNSIPVLQWGGWQDLNETGAIRGYVAFQNAMSGRPIDLPMENGQKISPRYQLIIGDWGHGLGMDIGVYLEWFDTWLKGEDTGLTDTATPLHFYEAGSERWVNLNIYPTVDNYTTWYLGSNESLDKQVPTDGKKYLRWGNPEEKDGKISFESVAIKDGMTIAGPLSLQLYAKSSNTNMEILARLYDVAPDGTTTVITKGAMLGSLSELDRQASWTDKNGKPVWPWPKLDKDVYLTPEETKLFEMALEPIQYGLQPEHKLRLILSTQSLGDKNVNGFLTADPGDLTTPQKQTLPGGVYTILLGKSTPTALDIPQLPYNAFPTAASGRTPTAWNELTRDFDSSGKFTLPLKW